MSITSDMWSREFGILWPNWLVFARRILQEVTVLLNESVLFRRKVSSAFANSSVLILLIAAMISFNAIEFNT